MQDAAVIAHVGGAETRGADVNLARLGDDHVVRLARERHHAVLRAHVRQRRDARADVTQQQLPNQPRLMPRLLADL